MEWWQIVLILIGAIIIGLVIGYVIYRFISSTNEERRTRSNNQYLLRKTEELKTPPTSQEQTAQTASIANKQMDEESLRMVPLFSRRSITVMLVGLLLGGGLGMGYWALSPTVNIEQEMGWPPIRVAEPLPDLYESTVKIQLEARGPTNTYLRGTRQQGEFWITKIHAYRFWQFLGEQVLEENPQFYHAPEELAMMILVKYDWEIETPTLELTATSPDPGEAFFLASFTPQALEDYMLEDERNVRLKDYSNALQEAESIKTAVLEAQRKLAALRTDAYSYDLNLNATYIALKAKIRALEAQVNTLATQQSTLIAEGSLEQGYTELAQQIGRASVALSEARNELASLESQSSSDHLEQNLAYAEASANVGRLQAQLNNQLDYLTESLIAASSENLEGGEVISYITVVQPTPPVELPPDRIRGRNALMAGVILGVGGAWLSLNRKWVVKEVLQGTSNPGEEIE